MYAFYHKLTEMSIFDASHMPFCRTKIFRVKVVEFKLENVLRRAARVQPVDDLCILYFDKQGDVFKSGRRM